MRGGDLSDEIPEIVKRVTPTGKFAKWPQVGVVSNALLQTHGLDSFVWAEKTDGLHVNIGIWNHKVYNLTNLRIPPVPLDFEVSYDGIAVLDTELYNEIYYIFDAAVVENEDVSSLEFLERLSKAESIIDKLGTKFVIKQFYPVKSVHELTEFIENDISPITENEIDGVVLQLKQAPYKSSKTPICFKYKPRYLHTVDFRLKYVYELKVYYLYLIGSFRDFLYNLQRRPKDNRYHKSHTGVEIKRERKGKAYRDSPLPETMEILFSSPLYPNLYYYENTNTWNSSGYSHRHIVDASLLIRDMNINEGSFDGKIVEMSLNDDNKWIPLRVREDKVTPNGYGIGLANVAQAFDPLVEPDANYFAKSRELTGASWEIQTIVHEVNSIYRQFIAESLINPLGADINAIDLCGGRGADEMNLYANGVVNLFVIDSDKTALHQYADRSNYLRARYNYKPLLKTYIDRPHQYSKSGNLFYLNILNHTLGSKYSEIIEDLSTRYEWSNLVRIRHDIGRRDNKRMQLVLMNFAIHYLCSKKVNMTALATFVSNVLAPGGIFIFTYYDGDFIMENRDKSTNLSKIGPFKIKIVKDTATSVIAKMPLPTIQAGDDFYREEPLVTKKILAALEPKLALVKDFSVYDECSQFINPEFLKHPVIEYLKLVRCRVMCSGK